jgi:hypothetical protein
MYISKCSRLVESYERDAFAAVAWRAKGSFCLILRTLLSEVSQEASHLYITYVYSAYLKSEYNRFRLLDSVSEELQFGENKSGEEISLVMLQIGEWK